MIRHKEGNLSLIFTVHISGWQAGKTHQVHKDWPLTDQATDFTRPSGHNIQGWSQLEVCVWKQFFLRYAGHTDTEKVFLCATSCLSSLPSQCMFYFNFLRVFQRIVMSHMIFVNWHCQISMLLWQLWKFAATFTLLHINEKILEKRHAIPYKNFAVVLFLFWKFEKTTQALALSINGHL